MCVLSLRGTHNTLISAVFLSPRPWDWKFMFVMHNKCMCLFNSNYTKSTNIHSLLYWCINIFVEQSSFDAHNTLIRTIYLLIKQTTTMYKLLWPMASYPKWNPKRILCSFAAAQLYRQQRRKFWLTVRVLHSHFRFVRVSWCVLRLTCQSVLDYCLHINSFPAIRPKTNGFGIVSCAKLKSARLKHCDMFLLSEICLRCFGAWNEWAR